MKRLLDRRWAPLLATFLAGCASNGHLVFATYTKTGVDVSTMNGAATQAMFGFKRFEGAVIPVDRENGVGEPEEAKAVFAAIDVDNRWFGGLDIFQVFATGEAAVQAARHPDRGVAAVMSARQGGGE